MAYFDRFVTNARGFEPEFGQLVDGQAVVDCYEHGLVDRLSIERCATPQGNLSVAVTIAVKALALGPSPQVEWSLDPHPCAPAQIGALTYRTRSRTPRRHD